MAHVSSLSFRGNSHLQGAGDRSWPPPEQPALIFLTLLVYLWAAQEASLDKSLQSHGEDNPIVGNADRAESSDKRVSCYRLCLPSPPFGDKPWEEIAS